MVRSICNLRGQLACLLALALALAVAFAFGGRLGAMYLYFVLALASTQSSKSLCTARHFQPSVSASITQAPCWPIFKKEAATGSPRRAPSENILGNKI